jgi:hypothetical protein
VVAVKAIVLNLLSAAAYGVLVFVFQDAQGKDGIRERTASKWWCRSSCS